MEKKIIFVSGSHRSGSTWLGNIIAQHPDVKYVSEPFNIELHRKNNPVIFWFEHISNKSENNRQNEIEQYLKSFYCTTLFDIRQSIRRAQTVKDAYRLFKDVYERRTTNHTLIKDPIAFFSSEWISRTLNAKTIILIRHPAAFVASIKLKNWTFDFNEFLKQELLINTYFPDYVKIIKNYTENQPDIIDQAILLWNIIHITILQYQKLNNDWYFIKHEDLSEFPIENFSKLFHYLNLEFLSSVKQQIIESSTSNEITNLKRNSKDNIKYWKKRLTQEEISRIKEKTYPIWPQFYKEKDW